MTALTQYARLESTGLWRPDPEGQRRDVIVSFGDATLVMTDMKGTALAHWSLPAIQRLNGSHMPALYSPDEEAEETLEIGDSDMVDALERVRRTVARRRPRSGRIRLAGFGLTAAALLALGIFWLPGALVSQTLAAVPPAKRSEIGATLLGHIQRLTGPSCRSPLGSQALARLKTRVMGEGTTGQIVVLPSTALEALALPGGIVALGREMVEDLDDPAATAGYVAAARTRAAAMDPLGRMLRASGIGATVRLFTTGDLPPEVYDAEAERLLGRQPAPPAEAALLEFFTTAELPTSPYAYAKDSTGESTLELIESDPYAGGTAPVVLSDADWIALQSICSG